VTIQHSLYIDALALAVYSLSLAWFVIFTAMVLEYRRQRIIPYYTIMTVVRTSRQQDDERNSPPPAQKIRALNYVDGTITSEVKFIKPEASYTQPALPNEWRLQPQNGKPEQIVIHIEPDGNPSQDQINIQRIINHLKQSSSTPIP
jgi:hypothetical protein